MEKNLKELLLRDICARLPYGLKVLYDNSLICQPSGLIKVNGRTCFTAFGVAMPLELDKIKPYLRPMSSMTEEEEIEYQNIVQNDGNWVNLLSQNLMDFFNRYHFDYRGLIPLGLALEAPEDMYN